MCLMIRTSGGMRFQVVTAAGVKMTVLRNILSCGLVQIDRRFRYDYCPRLQSYRSLESRQISTKFHGAPSRKIATSNGGIFCIC